MKLFAFLNKRIEELIIVAALGTMSVAIGLQVFMRYVVQSSLSWSEELSRYLFIFFVYAGISYGVRMKRHVRVEAFTLWLPERTQAWIRVISDLLFLFFSVIVIYHGYFVAARILRLDQVSPALELKMGYVFSTLPFCYVLTSIRLIQNLRASIGELLGKGKENAA